MLRTVNKGYGRLKCSRDQELEVVLHSLVWVACGLPLLGCCPRIAWLPSSCPRPGRDQDAEPPVCSICSRILSSPRTLAFYSAASRYICVQPPQRYPALQGIGDTPVPGLRGRKAGLVLSSRAGHVLESLSCRNIVGRTRTWELASPGLGSEMLLKRTRLGDAIVVHPCMETLSYGSIFSVCMYGVTQHVYIRVPCTGLGNSLHAVEASNTVQGVGVLHVPLGWEREVDARSFRAALRKRL